MAAVAACLALSLLGGCGSDAVVHIDGAANASISRSQLGRWMQSMVGADFREAIGARGPRGLVSEPADYSRCIDAAKLVAPRSFFNQLRLNRAGLGQVCRTLYRSVKAQALSFLIATKWAGIQGAERSVKITDAAKRARTHCAAQDVAPGCSAYRAPATISPSPEEILKQLVKPAQVHEKLSLGPVPPGRATAPTTPR